ncbi:hypothetical protein H1D32_03745 [Anaerobacillus sp. CMMVII]|uniref:hypothetical protein n=1 Tax=Anaerobacillus sp. CMMVII TaxID=2755588 RepID=UPI0021B6EB3D|nr:hypothetical protein [Anaerobacillus sp. CMMVII]MCT8136944.1 hypothetical protein [Anaerobacillus sp. CMMVII]
MIKQRLEFLWENRPSIHLQLYFDWKNNEAPDYFSKISLYFDRKINEDHLSDFSQIIDLLVESVRIVEEINTK